MLVSSTEYNSEGEAYKTIDPAGREDRQEFDDAGRVTKTIQNYTDGDPSTGGADEDVTVETTYNVDGQILTLTAKNPTTGDQTTSYVYGADKGGITPEIYRNDLLRAEIYPDSDDTTDPLGNGTDGIYDRVEYKYNRQGERIEKKGQNGTVHEYQYDSLGRQTAVKVTTLGTGVDGSVRRMATTYEVRGMAETLTSYATVGPASPAGSSSSSSSSSSSGAADAVNQVKFEYNDLGQLVKEYQEHDGVVDANTPYVGYNFDESASGGRYTKGLRPTSIRYPNGRLVHYTYGDSGSISDAMNRIDSIKDDDSGSPGDTLAQYSYLGASSIVRVDYPEPDLRYDLAHGTGDDPYDGPMDRFGRVTDLLWRDYGSSTDAVRIKHGYDRAGNRLWREDPVAASYGKNFDELYTYDGMYQLTNMQRGDLNAAKDGIVQGTKTFGEDWSLDMTGNWSTYKKDDDGDGTWDLNQPRTHNDANEITQIGGSSSHVAHDRCGNMTRTPKPNDWNAHFDLTYDPWNRLVKVEDGAAKIAEYTYDARNFRVVKKLFECAGDSSSSSSSSSGEPCETRHFFYNEKWQCLEERLECGGTLSSSADRHFLWGLSYIDDLLLRDRDTSSPKDGVLNERLYAVQDPNWNVTTIADSIATIRERYTYSAYGTPTVLSPTFATRASSSYNWETRFGSYRRDSEVEFYYVRNRVLRPGLGWLQRDPLGYEDGMNLSRYARGTPLMLSDPLGLWGSVVHEGFTTIWAMVYFIPFAAQLIGQGDESVDYGSTRPLPGGDYSYHFDYPYVPPSNVLRPFLADSRGGHHVHLMMESFEAAKLGRCNEAFRLLGRALHPLQDYYAHGNWWPGLSQGRMRGAHPGWYDNPARSGHTPFRIPIRLVDHRFTGGVLDLTRIIWTRAHTRFALEQWIRSTWSFGCACLCFLSTKYRTKRCFGAATAPPNNFARPAIANTGAVIPRLLPIPLPIPSPYPIPVPMP